MIIFSIYQGFVNVYLGELDACVPEEVSLSAFCVVALAGTALDRRERREPGGGFLPIEKELSLDSSCAEPKLNLSEAKGLL